MKTQNRANPRSFAPCALNRTTLPIALVLSLLPVVVQAMFTYEINPGRIGQPGTATITGYFGAGGAVAIPDTIVGCPVIGIGERAFYQNSTLTSVTIPGSVTNIGSGAFGFCANLIAIVVHPQNLFYSSLDGVLFDKSQTSLMQCPGAIAGSYPIPSGVTSIEGNAFAGCTRLTSVTIPKSVNNIGSGAFGFCSRLTSITVEAHSKSFSSLDGVLFNKRQTTLVQVPGARTGGYVIPDGVTRIGYLAFWGCGSLTSITMPNGVTSIEPWAFADCTSLATVTIPGSVTSIGVAAFADCTNLAGVFFKGNAPSLDSYPFMPSLFQGDTHVTVFYLPGTTGWGTTFGGRPTALWLPRVQTSDANFGVRTNQFGFTINWASGQKVVVEACTNLASPAWFPLRTNTLTADSFYFSDPEWMNYPGRFYRLRSP